ncbi:MAG: hypothetical protein EWM73_02613 [Nitrospira sp.]|nr:MAG: hypothetical protein EWM73_02613 [Nitrospira sp.]
MFGDIVTSGRSFAHQALLPIACEPQGSFDVSGLRAFITASQQNHHLTSALYVIHTVAWPVIDSHFGDALAHWPHIPRVSFRQALDPYLHACPCLNVAQSVKPPGIRLGLANRKPEVP